VAFAIIQLEGGRKAAEALATVSRTTKEPQAIRNLREELRLAVLEREGLVRALVEAKDRESAAVAAIQSDELPTLEAKIASLELRLHKEQGIDWSTETPAVSLRVAQSAIEEDEALVAIYVANRAIFLVALRSDGMVFRRVEVARDFVVALCKMIVESATFETGKELRKFDLTSSLQLNDLIFFPLRDFLPADCHLLIITSGPILTLPLGCLVADLPEVDDDEKFSSREVEQRIFSLGKWTSKKAPTDALMLLSQRRCWLADRYRVSLMPSAAPLSTRHEAATTKDPRRFLGFGDPEFDQAAAEEFGSIPETSRIMDALAQAFGGNADEDVFSGRGAAVDKLIELSESGELASCRVVCFATHAVYPRDGASLLADPGLLFANGEILTAFDVTGLRFNADFCLLTACFTGSPSGRSIADPLSGLAQAFLVAGARRLLISHWPVEVHATEQLLGAFAEALAENPTLAEALARAEGHLRSSSEYAHPAFWAGFSIVGDGGLIFGR
jgi:CHAT domain